MKTVCIILVTVQTTFVLYLLFSKKCHRTGKFITQQPMLGSLPHRNPTVKFPGRSAGLQTAV
jgi:hypothetical protein